MSLDVQSLLDDRGLAEVTDAAVFAVQGSLQRAVCRGQSAEVFSSMSGDFMKPVIDIVDQLLAAKVNVTVYNGQLDLIVDTMGQEVWVKKLKWPGLASFSKMKWTPLYVSADQSDTAAFYKSYENLAFYWILKAGHMVRETGFVCRVQVMKWNELPLC
ncbi:UNVERIFIED_CONTAM: hypothetical protein FKN15_043479 [Acipenser sinensis]